MVLYYIFLFLAWNSCIKLVPHQLTVILGLVSTQAVFLGIYIPKIGRDIYLGVLPCLCQEYHRNCTISYEFLIQWYFSSSSFIPRSSCCCNRNADKWIVMCEINTPSNSLLGSNWTISSFLTCWFLNHHSKIDRATLSIFLVHISIDELGFCQVLAHLIISSCPEKQDCSRS